MVMRSIKINFFKCSANQNLRITWAVVLVFFLAKQADGQSDCNVKVPEKDEKFQIYLKGFRWTTPKGNSNVDRNTIPHGEVATFHCDHGFINNDFLGTTYTFECINGKFNGTLNYEDLFCRSDFHKNTKTCQVPNVCLRSKLLNCDGKNLQVFRVFSKKNEGLKHLYTVCFDKNIMRTKFVFQPRGYENTTHIRESRRYVWGFDHFGRNAFEKLKLSEGYLSRVQKKRITNAFPNRYNKNKKYPYTFNRGHLAPYADFVDPDDKKATCEYINAAPQWKEFNGNSWSVVEREARELVQENPLEWEIYTGTYGSISTPRGPLFVSPFFDKNGRFLKGFVPVPKLYWKIVHNVKEKDKSRVFIGVNNPELKSPDEFTDKYLICKPLRNSQGTFYRGSEFKGFIYECNLLEFLEKLLKNEGLFSFLFEQKVRTFSNFGAPKMITTPAEREGADNRKMKKKTGGAVVDGLHD